jgi:hypothetical protein
MSKIDDMIAELDDQLTDIETAKAAAAENGKGPGDYDLSVLTSAVKQDRLATEQVKLAREAQVLNSTIGQPVASSGSPRNTYSGFKVGGSDYDVIDDNEESRRMIQYDDQGNVDPSSPVQVIGKNSSGGFVLAAQSEQRGVAKSKIPFTPEQGINFPSLESDSAGARGKMSSIHSGEFKHPTDVFDPNAAKQIYDIYQRTDKN